MMYMNLSYGSCIADVQCIIRRVGGPEMAGSFLIVLVNSEICAIVGLSMMKTDFVLIDGGRSDLMEYICKVRESVHEWRYLERGIHIRGYITADSGLLCPSVRRIAVKRSRL